MNTDHDLIEIVKSGNLAAYGELVGRYERSVLAAVSAEIRDPNLALRITTKTFKRVYRHLDEFADAAAFGPWLLEIAQRTTMTALRKLPLAGCQGDPMESSSCDDLEWIESEHLLSLVARLADEDRQLIGLRYFDHYSPAEIATMMDRPVSDVNQSIRRAVQRLRYRWEWSLEVSA